VTRRLFTPDPLLFDLPPTSAATDVYRFVDNRNTNTLMC